jgi:exonuclease SbcC
MKTCSKEADRLLDRLELQKITRKTIAEYIVYLMQVVRSRIEGDVGRILSDITAGRYDRVLIDDDFGLLVRDIDNDYPVERFSGGEQDDIAVALRIALSRYLATLHQVPEPTFLIFDEIFGSQDEERRNNLLSALRSIESHFPQILLISHIPELQGEFAHTLLIELGSDQVSRIQEVTQ